MTSAISTQLNGDVFARALVSGIHGLVNKQDLLNRINVFPVADGDTGTNLSLSLGSALPLLEKPEEKHLGTMLAAVADTLLDGSRGNSGAIMAQFFQGISDFAGELSRFTTYTFSKAVALGNDYAHDALAQPREGTILTAIAAFAASIQEQAVQHDVERFAPVLEAGLESVRVAVAETPNQLDVLKKAGVVDAGAEGFAALIAGMVDYIVSGTEIPKPDLSVLFDAELSLETSADGEESSYRFCTECLVSGIELDRRKLREALSELGDSLVLAGTKRKAKIHIHVNDPDRVFETARRFGELSAEKADDMHRQHVSSHNDARHFAVIADSAADISDKDMERLDIHIVPLRIQFGERGYLDKVSISTEEFFHELSTNPQHPTTSQPAPGDFRRQFQFLASHFADVISLNVTSRVSGTLQAADSAADRVDAPGRIRIVDTRNASMGQGLLAVYAAECAAAGLTADTTEAAIRTLIPETRTFAIFDDLRYAVRGGRVPSWVRTVATLLRLTPIIRNVPDGRVGTATFLVGRRQRLQKFARYVARQSSVDGPLSVAIGHAVCLDDAKRLEQCLRENLPDIQRINISELGTAFGVHGGPRTLVVATQPWRAPTSPPAQ